MLAHQSPKVLTWYPDRSYSGTEGAIVMPAQPEQRRQLRGRFRPMFHPGIGHLVCAVGSRQEMVFSPVRR
ncbi:hypothetical protein ACIQFW_15785, partial [Streptomyces ardesiacus]|uniref:hypothetical protein n=1 Tax=Streptomyces ardesiacus TaxID=285564 RepID=UPI0037F85A53